MADPISIFAKITIKEDNFNKFLASKPTDPMLTDNWKEWWDSRKDMYGKIKLSQNILLSYDYDTNKEIIDGWLSDFESVSFSNYNPQTELWHFGIMNFAGNYEEMLPIIAFVKSIENYKEPVKNDFCIVFPYYTDYPAVNALLLFNDNTAYLDPNVSSMRQINKEIDLYITENIEWCMEEFSYSEGYDDDFEDANDYESFVSPPPPSSFFAKISIRQDALHEFLKSAPEKFVFNDEWKQWLKSRRFFESNIDNIEVKKIDKENIHKIFDDVFFKEGAFYDYNPETEILHLGIIEYTRIYEEMLPLLALIKSIDKYKENSKDDFVLVYSSRIPVEKIPKAVMYNMGSFCLMHTDDIDDIIDEVQALIVFKENKGTIINKVVSEADIPENILQYANINLEGK